MSDAIDVANNRASLRLRAAAQVTVSNPTTLTPGGKLDGMAVLYQLASSPSTASNALALLHELQVHQVELDLQQEELLNSRAELERELLRQKSLVERAPVGYMTIDARTTLCEINPAGARLLGAAPDEMLGRRLDSLLSASSARRLQSLLARARDGLASQTCELQLAPLVGDIRNVHAAVDNDTTDGSFLLALMVAPSRDLADLT